jgi:hypothetical protein
VAAGTAVAPRIDVSETDGNIKIEAERLGVEGRMDHFPMVLSPCIVQGPGVAGSDARTMGGYGCGNQL